jgi:tRNA G10  N-methylase Trm11
MVDIIIKNKKIIDFYNKHNTIDIERMNLILIEIYEKILEELNGNISKNVYQDILAKLETKDNEINLIKNEILLSMKTNMELQRSDINNVIISKFYELRNNNIEDMKHILDKSNNENMLKIIERIEKINTIITEIVPKSQIQYHNQHELTMRNFKDDIQKNIEMMKGDINLDKLNIIISEKYNKLISSVQDNILNYVTSYQRVLQHLIW